MEKPDLIILNTSFVCPATPSEKKHLFLSSMDIIWKNLHYNRRVIFYELNADEYQSAIDNLKRSLSMALVYFYPIAGRLAVDENGRTTIDCNDRGVEFSEAFIDVDFNDVQSSNFQLEAFYNQLASWDEQNRSEIFEMPLFSVQVTQFKSDGIALGFAHSHVIVDGHSMWHFMKSWAECARYVPISMPPLHIRDALKIENPSKEMARLNFEAEGSDEEGIAPVQNGRLVQKLFHFSAEMIAKLKKAAQKEGGRTYTSYEAICSHFWRCITRARRVDDDQKVRFLVLCNLRSRLTPPQPAAYFGNMVISALAYATAGELRRESLGDTAARIHNASASCNEAALWGTLHWLELHGNTFGKTNQFRKSIGLKVASSPRFPVYEVDFGWGKPAAVRTARVREDGEIVMFPGREEEGSVDICMPLVARSMAELEKDPDFLSF